MSLSRISFSTNAYPGDNSQKDLKRIGEGFRELLQAIQDGNLPDARRAYDSLTCLMANTYRILSGQLKKDYHAIGQALKAGDVYDAQKAVSELQYDLKTLGSAGRRQYVHRGAEYYHPPLAPNNISHLYAPESIDSQTVGRNIDIRI